MASDYYKSDEQIRSFAQIKAISLTYALGQYCRTK